MRANGLLLGGVAAALFACWSAPGELPRDAGPGAVDAGPRDCTGPEDYALTQEALTQRCPQAGGHGEAVPPHAEACPDGRGPVLFTADDDGGPPPACFAFPDGGAISLLCCPL